MRVKIFSLIALFIACFCGCISFFHPQLKKELLAREVSKNQIDVIKKTIFNEGYKKIGTEDGLWQGALDTQYIKEILTDKIKTTLLILISFKESENFNHFHNFGISILNNNQSNTPEIKAEINRMEEILYNKLLEISDRKNVKRGNKEIYATEEGSYWPWAWKTNSQKK
ncbi:MAG: hypothetical protein ACKVQC_01720 [Elusimicrobiota bacterium]